GATPGGKRLGRARLGAGFDPVLAGCRQVVAHGADLPGVGLAICGFYPTDVTGAGGRDRGAGFFERSGRASARGTGDAKAGAQRGGVFVARSVGGGAGGFFGLCAGQGEPAHPGGVVTRRGDASGGGSRGNGTVDGAVGLWRRGAPDGIAAAAGEGRGPGA